MSSVQPTTAQPPSQVPFGRSTLLGPLARGGMGALHLTRLSGAEGFDEAAARGQGGGALRR
jgi:hypothetical protein